MTETSAAGGVVVRGSALREIAAHARRAAPDECCGLLVGTGARIESSHAARNLRRSPTRYLVDPADHFAAIKFGRKAGLAVVGAYHSHPTSAASPSPTDEREATNPDFLYLIVSLVTAQTRAFRLVDGRMEEIPLRVVSDAETSEVAYSRGNLPWMTTLVRTAWTTSSRRLRVRRTS